MFYVKAIDWISNKALVVDTEDETEEAWSIDELLGLSIKIFGVDKANDTVNVGTTDCVLYQMLRYKMAGLLPNVCRVITGEGYGIKEGCSLSFRAEDKPSLRHIRLPYGVSFLKVNFCFEAYNLEDVDLPNTLIMISDNAFFNCESLRHIDLPSCLQSMGGWIFKNCFGLESIVIPKTVRSIGNSCFSGCRSLKTAEFLCENVEMTFHRQFEGCDKLEVLKMPYQFYRRKCIGITRQEIPSLKEIIVSDVDELKLSEMPDVHGVVIKTRSNSYWR